jgi:heme-degrading monooxygenase HmoA
MRCKFSGKQFKMIRVLIERRIAEGLEHYYDCTIKRTVSTVTKAPGCISGESLKDSRNPNRRIVMSKWTSKEHWDNWFHSDERRNVISEITPMLEGSEKITMLELTA